MTRKILWHFLVTCFVLFAGIPGQTSNSQTTTVRPTGRVHEVKVNPDGTFDRPNITIVAGDTVKWVGLGRTDSIVQITYPGRVSRETDVCGVRDTNHLHAFTDDPNEFTGPQRYGVSGIFALGPYAGGISKVPAGTLCRCAMTRTSGCKISSVQGATEKLCPEEGNLYETLDDTWKNQDITGVIIRLSWSDIQKDTGSAIEYDWSALDREMNRAVAHGKLFTLDMRAGIDGTPKWIFTDYQRRGTPAAGPVQKLVFRDWGSSDLPSGAGCGSRMELGSPADPEYRRLFTAMMRELARHVATDARWFQALAHVKVSGANMFSSENRLPNKCADLKGERFREGGDGFLDPGCTCNTLVWAQAGYTPEKLYEFYRHVGHAIYEGFFHKKSLAYQLIQAGFPQVTNETSFLGNTLFNVRRRPLGSTSPVVGGTVQTETILEQMRQGRFVHPDGTQRDPQTGQLFVVQHNGVGRAREEDGLTPCFDLPKVSLPSLRIWLPGSVPLPPNTRGSTREGCPNRWAVDEGTFFNQITGFQTNNDKKTADDASTESHVKGVNDPCDVESALMNMTKNSNGVFLEVYEQRLWEISDRKGQGPTAKTLGGGRCHAKWATAPTSYNLHSWMLGLHERRRELAKRINNPYAADPFPNTHEFTFTQASTQQRTFYYINPSKCSTAAREKRLGSITVLARREMQ